MSLEKIISYSKVRDVKDPAFGTTGSAGFDVFVPRDLGDNSITIYPKKSVKIPTGLHFNIPDGYALIFFNKSGIASKKSLVLGACVIDSDYQGEVIVNLHNIGEDMQVLFPDDPISQLILLETPNVVLEQTPMSELYQQTTSRGAGGFGSTFQTKG
jgi:dUTP pyrophosphatase